MHRWLAYINGHFQEVLRTKKSAHSIGIGFAIGTFMAILPLFGLSALFCVLIILVFKQVNKFAVFFALALWNPITLVPVYLLGINIGNVIFGDSPIVEFEVDLVYRIYFLTRRMVVGNFILAVLLSVVSYFIVRRMVFWYRRVV